MNAGVDKQLSDYFKSELPKDFPPCPGGQTESASITKAWTRTVTYAIAASLLLVLGLKIIPGGLSKSPMTDDPWGRATAEGNVMKAFEADDRK